jgi:feruloyl esterase
MKRLVSGLAVMVCLGGVGYAQTPGQFEDWTIASTLQAPKMACRDLHALTGYDFSIDAATLVPARNGVPEFCLVQGQILPEIRFEVSLPVSWNRRLYMFGNGGLAGESFSVPVRIQRRDAALTKGFAVTATNTGHDAAREPGASFAQSPQKLIDFAYRAVHVTAVTAKSIARSYYDAAPTRSYFNGCSEGGRQGFVEAQRFPDDFDGLALGAAVIDFTGNFLDGRHRAIAAEALTREKVKLAADAVYAKCDAVDGLKDGLIDDPRRCQFNPATDVPRCSAGGGVNCLTDADVKAFEAIYRGVVMASGAVVHPGLPVAAEPGWEGWQIPAANGQPPSKRQFSQSFFKYMMTPGTEVDWRSFDVDRDIDKVKNIGALLNAVDPDLRRFRARSGRIIQAWGFAEPALNPLTGINYYESVRTTMGAAATDDFFKLYMVPGMFHCGGGPGPDEADLMTALVNWVERGIAPTQIVARKRVNGTVVRTRPLCPYPMVARYKGSGSIDDAANFACTNPGPALTSSK